MSKAFTKDDAPAPDAGEHADEALPPGPRHVTPDGHAAFLAELDAIRTTLRPPLAARVREAPQDLDAQAALRAVDRRAAWISRRQPWWVVVPPGPGDRVAFGAWVTVVLDEPSEAAPGSNGAERVVRLVGPDEVDAAQGRVSVESPLGRALVGRRVDDTVRIRRPRGDVEGVITDIRYGA